jgi:uncharacterized protein
MAAAWHAGERAVQERLGGTGLADRLLGGIRAELPGNGRRFLARQPWLLLAVRAADGTVWPTVVSGRPGFLATPAPDLVTVTASLVAGDPLAAAIEARAPVGTLAIEPGMRRRLRVNGRLRPGPGGFAIAIDQAVSNCPKYIHRRMLDPRWQPRPPEPVSVADALSAGQQAWIERADTAFVASAGADGSLDLSHRGGERGFLGVEDGRITWDELPGNNMYLTLGNLEQISGAGLLIAEPATGSTLHISGDGAVIYAAGASPRMVLTPRQVVERRHGAPAPWHDLADGPT